MSSHCRRRPYNRLTACRRPAGRRFSRLARLGGLPLYSAGFGGIAKGVWSMNVLVAGGAGYIGSHTVKRLKEAGHSPAIYDNASRGHRAVVDILKVPAVIADL